MHPMAATTSVTKGHDSIGVGLLGNPQMTNSFPLIGVPAELDSTHSAVSVFLNFFKKNSPQFRCGKHDSLRPPPRVVVDLLRVPLNEVLDSNR
jgi:hypothetical protein